MHVAPNPPCYRGCAQIPDPAATLNMGANEPTPVSRLAPETLSQIFITYSRIPSMAVSKRLQWTKVTHVSRQWREIGLSCPQLWSDIVCTPSPWTTVMFERSKDVPLSLTFPHGVTFSADLEDLITAAMSQPSRLKDLTILTVTEFAKKRLEELTYSHTLRTLHVEGGSHNRIALPDTLLSQGTPKLKHVVFRGCTIDWASPIFSGLTSLRLIFCPATLQQDPTAFIDALERMPNLETLDINVLLPVFGAGTLSRVVPMACIKKLTMRGKLEECSGALQHMALPEAAILNFELTGDSDEDSGVAAFVSALTSSWLSAPLSTANDSKSFDIRSLQIDDDCIRGWFAVVELTGLDPNVRIRFGQDVSQDGDLTSKLVSILPLTNLHKLDITKALDENVMSALSRIPSIKSVYISETPASRVLDFLRKDPAFQQTEMTPATRFPGLELLSLESVMFFGPYEGIDGAIQLDDLLNLLMWRCESGVEIQKITFVYCRNFSQGDFDLVGEVVAETEWDEDFIDHSPEPDPSLGPLMFALWMASQRY